MADLLKAPAISSPIDDPRQWLAAYLHARAQLASYRSDFQCDPACTRPGCKDPDLHVPVSLIDLLGAARHRDESVSELYLRNYSLGLVSHERNDRFGRVSVKLKKPCPFLDNNRCSIYPVRPLPCILFPEYLVQRGTFAVEAGKELFRDYLCLQRPLPLSPSRAKIIAQLRSMWERESLVTSFSLFHHAQCYVDSSNLRQEFCPAAGSPDGAGAQWGSGLPRPSAPQGLENVLLEHLADCPPFTGIREKIAQLNTREGQMEFLQLWQDELLLKRLMQGGDDRALVFRFVKGKLKAKRRGIIPAEYHFY